MLEFIKKNCLINSSFLHFSANFVLLYHNIKELGKLCQNITANVFILNYHRKDAFIWHIFFTVKCENSDLYCYKIISCGFLSYEWAKPPIRYP